MLSNPKVVKDDVVRWLKKYFESEGDGRSAVVNIFGGRNSAVTAALCVEALGADRVVPIILTDGDQPDYAKEHRLLDHLGLTDNVIRVDVRKTVGSVMHAVLVSYGDLSNRAGNCLVPRARMMVLYAIAESLPNGGLVANTCSLSENFVGLPVKHGNDAGDFAPIADLLEEDVDQLCRELGLEEGMIEEHLDKAMPDFTYQQLDDYIMAGSSGCDDTDRKIAAMHNISIQSGKKLPRFYMPRFTNYGDWTDEMKNAYQVYMESAG